MSRFCLAGAPLDTGNRGVEALGLSVLAAIDRAVPHSHVTVLDNGWGTRPAPPGVTRQTEVLLCGARRSRRLHRPESWANIRASQALGGLRNPVARALSRARAVLDVSGGDSFADVYGPGRLQTVLEPKLAALRAGRPLVLLPQTYGPFQDADARRRAAEVVKRARVAMARDTESFAVLQDLLGQDVDPERHLLGVDLAFALPPRRPDAPHHRRLVEHVEAPRSQPLVGVNVSGLLAADASRFGLTAPYADTMRRLVEALVAAGAHVLLVPHVRDVALHAESDDAAARSLQAALSDAARGAVQVVPDDLGAREVKWLIGELDWFCGARMHATIAALSSAVPTTGVAYSMKMRGVFASCGAGDEVADPRTMSGDEVLSRLLDGFARREAVGEQLRASSPPVVQQSAAQLDGVLRQLAVDEQAGVPA